MKMKRPTQADVARLAGVSRATVSYVLNGLKSNVPISDGTRQRVLETMQKVGYEPDTRAQSLRSGDSKTIGLLIPDIHNPHFWQMVEGVEEETRKAGYDLLLAHSSSDITREEYCLRALSRRTISGLIIIKTTDTLKPHIVEQLLASHHPIAEAGVAPSKFDSVVANYRQGTREVLRHLLALGHQHFAFIHGVAGAHTGLDRLEVFRQLLKKAGIPEAQRRVEHCGITPQDSYQAAHKVLSGDPRPTALLVINDLLAIGVLRAVTDLGLHVPKDISVASFDDLPISSYLVPRLTTVGRDTKAEGQMLTKLLLERLRSREGPPKVVKMPSRLIVRESTGPAPQLMAQHASKKRKQKGA
jgi:LacI family transcriptional regulator